MQHNSRFTGNSRSPDREPDLKEIVMGLHWDPPEDASADPEDLDAVCVLLDGEQRVLEVIHPGNPRNTDGSVVHTGDSRTGAGEWDDERIFVFLAALPATVSSVAFFVVSVKDRPFGEIRGASCHVSDHATEYKWIDVKLTPLREQTAHFVALLRRDATGWKFSKDADAISGERVAGLISLVKEKNRALI